MAQIRVLIVDDSSFMRTMLSRMIAKDPRFEIVGTAENGQIGVQKTLELKPDVVTMDVEMPVMTGLDALGAIMQQCPTPVVMISTLTESGAKITMEALDKGAVDFLPKALQDGDRNIFKAGEAIHAKLAAAASAQVKSAQAALAVPVAAPAPLPSALAQGGKVFKVLVIGASTGGPKALQMVLQNLPAQLGVPVVVAQHMPAQFTPALAQRLNEISPLKVCELQTGMQVQPNTVYIAPGGFHSRIEGNSGAAILNVAEDHGESVYKPSVGVLAKSALQVYGSHVLAVMLTGMGDDGAREFAEIKKAGGHVIAQDEATSTVYGMPRSVVELGGATEALPLQNIASRVQQVLGR